MTTQCKFAKSDMTPCVLRDGAICFCIGLGDMPICVGCERGPAAIGVPFPPDWEKTVMEARPKQGRRKR